MQTESVSRLQAMGIDVWLTRTQPLAPESASQVPRVRLSAGTGDWLLVTRGPVPERWTRLVADITAAISPERCRFGQWADNEAAGTGLDELAERGIRRVLSLGGVAGEHPAVLAAPELETLANDASARKTLWELLSGRL